LVAAQSRLRHWEERPESVIDTCEDISARIDQVPRRIVEQLRSQVDALLDGQQRQLLRLGSFVDELTRRRTVGRELLLNAIQQTMVRDQARCQRLNWSRLSEQGQSELRDNEVIWPTEPYDFSVCAPDQGWGTELRERWLAAGLGADALVDVLNDLGTATAKGLIALHFRSWRFTSARLHC
jgi:hypothetical protein